MSDGKDQIEWKDTVKMKPDFLEDFHDQKDFFKSLYEVMKPDHMGYPEWVKAHCFTIDLLLPFLAMHGYTLQKSRSKKEFHDIHETIEEFKRKRSERLGKSLEKRIEEGV